MTFLSSLGLRLLIVHSLLMFYVVVGQSSPDCGNVKTCDLDCDFGFITDNNGCPICLCKPEIQTSGEVEVKPGEKQELFCVVTEVPSASIKGWNHNDHVYFRDSSHDIDHDGQDDIVVFDNNTLLILNTTEINTGLYTCFIGIELNGHMYNITAQLKITYKDRDGIGRPKEHRSIPVAASASAGSLVIVLLAIVVWYFLIRKQLLRDVRSRKHQHHRRHSSHRHGSRHGHHSSRHGSVRGEPGSHQNSMKVKCQKTIDDIENGGCLEEKQLFEACSRCPQNTNISEDMSTQDCSNKVYTSPKVHPSPQTPSHDEQSPKLCHHSSHHYSDVAAHVDESPIMQRHGSHKKHRHGSRVEATPSVHCQCVNSENHHHSSSVKRYRSHKRHLKEAFGENSPMLQRKESRKQLNYNNHGEYRPESTSGYHCSLRQGHNPHTECQPPQTPMPCGLLPLAASDITVETMDAHTYEETINQ
ncbi:uncharacterized protein LOC144443468 [Glandiceps talaboti]